MASIYLLYYEIIKLTEEFIKSRIIKRIDYVSVY